MIEHPKNLILKTISSTSIVGGMHSRAFLILTFSALPGHEAIHKNMLEEITTLLEQLALVSKESDSWAIMNAHEVINYKMEFDLNNPYIPTKEEYNRYT
jgi:hypothetical protein